VGHLHGFAGEAALTSPGRHPAPLTSPDAFSVVARRAGLWLLFLAPFFYASYGFANWLASRRDDVGTIVFAWERHVPFLAWTIVPYWSINLFYALSLLLNRTRQGVDRLACRYLFVQIVAVSFFIALPLKASFVRPETDGLPGFLFQVLGGFDMPFNQAPSLHIALLVIIWDHWRHALGGAWRMVWHVWCLLIGVSVLTTWQHHFIDIPTGALLGFTALWLFPREGDVPVSRDALAHRRDENAARRERSSRLAWRYGLGALGLVAFTWLLVPLAPSAMVLVWPALALAIVAFAYGTLSVAPFQKAADGSVMLAARILLWPTRLGARINAWAWTRRLPAHVPIADGVSLGRFPDAMEADGFVTIIDLAAELVRPADIRREWVSIPMLDLVPPRAEEVEAAAMTVERARLAGPVLVCCALGFQRSATVVAQWLVMTGRAADVERAAAMIAAAGRPVHLAPVAASEAVRP
jgi:protein-tyrosine phosphatase